MGGRYIKDAATDTVHDRENLDEQCNTDDITQENKRTGDDLKDLITPKTKFCRWCMARRAARAAKRQSRAALSEGTPPSPSEEETNEPTPTAARGTEDPGAEGEGPPEPSKPAD